jgi:hypothetical protein
MQHMSETMKFEVSNGVKADWVPVFSSVTKALNLSPTILKFSVSIQAATSQR